MALGVRIKDEVTCAKLLSNHTAVVTALKLYGPFVYSAAADGTVLKWEAETSTLLQTFQGHTHRVTCLDVTKGCLYSGSFDCTVRAWNDTSNTVRLAYLAKSPEETSFDGVVQAAGCLQVFLGHHKAVTSLQLDEDAGRLYTASKDRTIRIWDPETAECLRVLAGHTDLVTQLCLHESSLYSASLDTTIRCWDNGKCVKIFEGHSAGVLTLCVVGQVVYSGADDGMIKLHSVKTSRCIRTYQEHSEGVTALDVADDVVYSGSRDGRVSACLVQSIQSVTITLNPSNPVFALKAQGPLLYFGGIDCKIRAYKIDDVSFPLMPDIRPEDADLDGFQVGMDEGDDSFDGADVPADDCVLSLSGHNGPVRVIFQTEGILYSAGDDKCVRGWHLRSGKCILECRGSSPSMCFALDAAGPLFTGLSDGRISAWDVESGKELYSWEAHTGPVLTMQFTGDKLYSGSNDGAVRIWVKNIGTDRMALTQSFEAHTDSLSALVVFDGRLFTGSLDSTVKIWNLKTFSCIGKVHCPGEAGVTCMAPFLRMLFWGDEDGRIHCLNVRQSIDSASSGKGHRAAVSSLHASDSTLFSCSEDFTVKIWSPWKLECMATIQVARFRCVRSLSSQGFTFFGGCDDGAIRLWAESAAVRMRIEQQAHIPAQRGTVEFFEDLNAKYDQRGDELVVPVGINAGANSQPSIPGRSDIDSLETVALSLARGENAVTLERALKPDEETLEVDAPCVRHLVVHAPLVHSDRAHRLQDIIHDGFNTVSHMVVCDSFLWVANEECELRVWDLQSGSESGVLTGHTGTIQHMGTIDSIVFSAGSDQSLRAWAIVNDVPQSVKTIDIDGVLGCFTLLPNALFLLTKSTSIQEIKTSDWSMGQLLAERPSRVTCLQGHGDRLFCGDVDGRIEVWSRPTDRFHPLAKFNGAVTAMCVTGVGKVCALDNLGHIRLLQQDSFHVSHVMHVSCPGPVAWIDIFGNDLFVASRHAAAAFDLESGQRRSQFYSESPEPMTCFSVHEGVFYAGARECVKVWLTHFVRIVEPPRVPLKESSSASKTSDTGEGAGHVEVVPVSRPKPARVPAPSSSLQQKHRTTIPFSEVEEYERRMAQARAKMGLRNAKKAMSPQKPGVSAQVKEIVRRKSLKQVNPGEVLFTVLANRSRLLPQQTELKEKDPVLRAEEYLRRSGYDESKHVRRDIWKVLQLEGNGEST